MGQGWVALCRAACCTGLICKSGNVSRGWLEGLGLLSRDQAKLAMPLLAPSSLFGSGAHRLLCLPQYAYEVFNIEKSSILVVYSMLTQTVGKSL